MKLTWFGGTTIRVHIGGAILVADPDSRPGPDGRGELLSAVDRVFGLGNDLSLPQIDPATWRAHPVRRPIDDPGADESVQLFRIGSGAVLIVATGEPPLMLIDGDQAPEFGRWADGGVFVLFGGAALLAGAARLLEAGRPKLIALAAGEQEVEQVISALRDRLGGAALVALEPALALEA